MSDTALNKIIQYGTRANRIAFTPSPASGSQVLYLWYETDHAPDTWAWDGSAWQQINTAGSGTVTTTGSPASGNLSKFSGATSITNGDLSGDVATSGTLATTIQANAVTTSKINASAVTLAKIANAASNSVLVGSGAAGSGSAYTEIALGTGLSMSGTTLNASGSSGGLTLLEQHTASSSATLDFTTAISSTYDDYRVEVVGLVAGTNNTDFQMLVSTDGGSTWANSGYAWMRESDFIGGSGMAPGSSASDSKFVIFPGFDTSIADASLDASIAIKHPGNATLSTVYFGQMTTWYQPSSPRFYATVLIGGKWRTQTAVSALRFQMSSGNIASGTIRVYGLAK